MKPRLWKSDGLWLCGLFLSVDAQLLGLGYTPKQAYEDWKHLNPRSGGSAAQP